MASRVLRGTIIMMAAGLLAVLALAVSACGGGGTTTGGYSGAGGNTSSGQASQSGSGGSGPIDACKIVTQADATSLFGKPAVEQEGQLNLDSNMIGECLWTWDTETSNQLIQFRIWNGPQYHSAAAAGARPLDVGEQGWIESKPLLGVDAEWIQDGKTVTLSYSTIGSDVPDAATKMEQVKALAKKAAGQI